MELQFAKFDPTGNMTILVQTPVARARQPEVAAALMSYASVGAEQVGFIEPASLPGAQARLQMMGGEFCGNASMCLAAWLARSGGLEQTQVTLEVSGCAAPVRCSIRSGDGHALGTVDMPLPERIGQAEGLPAVFFPGITHLIAPASDFPDTARAEDFLRRTARSLGAEGVGLLLIDKAASRMTPCVYVSETDSVVWEHGCASGTAAMAAWLSASAGREEVRLTQPGGVMSARAELENGRIARLTVSGSVRLAAQGVAWI